MKEGGVGGMGGCAEGGGSGAAPMGPWGCECEEGGPCGGGSSGVGLAEQSVALGRNEGGWDRGGVRGLYPYGVLPCPAVPELRCSLLPFMAAVAFPPFFLGRFFLHERRSQPAQLLAWRSPSRSPRCLFEAVCEPRCDACRRHRAQPVLPRGRWPNGSPWLGSWLSLAAC